MIILFRRKNSLILIFSLLLWLSHETYSQDYHPYSPFSKFGIGLLQPQANTLEKSIGNITAGARDISGAVLINIGNPASYSSIRLTVFDVGINYLYKNIQSTSQIQAANSLGFSYFQVGVPVSKKSGLALGITPFSRKGYSYLDTSVVGSSNVINTNQGSGDISKAFVGYGINISKSISLGANVGFLFGKFEDRNDVSFSPFVSFPTRVVISNSFLGWSLDVGAQYSKLIKKNIQVVLGYASSMSSNLEVRQNYFFGKILSQSNGLRLDTLQSSNRNFNVQFPTRHKAGISIEKKQKWFVGLDVRYENWSDFNFDNMYGNLTASKGISLGGQYIPNALSVREYYKIVQYRIGFRYDILNIVHNNQAVKEYGVSIGFGLPFKRLQNTFPNLHLGFEYVQRANVVQNAISEKVFNLYLGIAVNDRWFLKHSYD